MHVVFIDTEVVFAENKLHMLELLIHCCMKKAKFDLLLSKIRFGGEYNFLKYVIEFETIILEIDLIVIKKKETEYRQWFYLLNKIRFVIYLFDLEFLIYMVTYLFSILN